MAVEIVPSRVETDPRLGLFQRALERLAVQILGAFVEQRRQQVGQPVSELTEWQIWIWYEHYKFFRRFVLGFYDPGFRDLLFRPERAGSMYKAMVRVLAGDDRPSLFTRLQIKFFLALTRIQGRMTLVERIHDKDGGSTNGSTNDG